MTGQPYPKAIANAPELQLEEQFYYTAFWSLHSDRNYELGPIPYSSIKRYCDDYCLDFDQFERVAFVISDVDNWFLGYSHEKINRKHKAKK